jgi:hypothetical protein
MGTSSNWSFHGQVLSLVHVHTRKTPFPTAELLFDGSAYRLPWNGSRSMPDSSTLAVPSIDYAIFLVNAVKFHCSQLVHLLEEDEFMLDLHAFYANADNELSKDTLWYIHFLLIMAFGKSFVQQKHHATRLPGTDFFVQALRLLPDTNRLCREPILAAEILCCIALYLQALDSRNAAHVTVRVSCLANYRNTTNVYKDRPGDAHRASARHAHGHAHRSGRIGSPTMSQDMVDNLYPRSSDDFIDGVTTVNPRRGHHLSTPKLSGRIPTDCSTYHADQTCAHICRDS